MSMESQFTHVHDTPPPGAAADWTILQNWDAFTADEHAMWDKLFARQSDMLPGRAADAGTDGGTGAATDLFTDHGPEYAAEGAADGGFGVATGHG